MPQKKRANGRRSEPKLFRCTGFGDCNMVFTRSEHLARHARKHTGEKPFKCVVPNCDRMFSRFDNMMQHTHTHNRTKKKDSPELSDNKKSPMSLPDDMMMPKSPGSYGNDVQFHYNIHDHHRYLQLPPSRRTSYSSNSSNGVYQSMGNPCPVSYPHPEYYQSLPASPSSEEDYHHHHSHPPQAYFHRPPPLSAATYPLPPINNNTTNTTNNNNNRVYSQVSTSTSTSWAPAYYPANSVHHSFAQPPPPPLPQPPSRHRLENSPPYSLPVSALPSPNYNHSAPDSSITSLASTAVQTPKTMATTTTPPTAVDYFSSRSTSAAYHKPHSITSKAFGAAVMGNCSKNSDLDTPMTQLRKRLSYFDLSTPINELGSTPIKEETIEEDDTDDEHSSPESSPDDDHEKTGVDITEDEYEALQGFGKFCTEPVVLEKSDNKSNNSDENDWKETLKLPALKNISPTTTLSAASLTSQVHAFRQQIKVVEESFQRRIRNSAF